MRDLIVSMQVEGVLGVFATYFIATVTGYLTVKALCPLYLCDRTRAEKLMLSWVAGTLVTLVLLVALGMNAYFSRKAVWITTITWAVTAGSLCYLRAKQGFLPPKSFDLPSAGPHSIAAPLAVRIAVGMAVVALGILPLLVSLTCPVPSWMDVLETNLAPVARVLAFGTYDPAHALPAAAYPLNRSVPLYTAYFSYGGALFGLSAAQVISASLLPHLLVTLLSLWTFARRLMAPIGATVALWMWSLSFGYVHLQDARSTCWALPVLFFLLGEGHRFLGLVPIPWNVSKVAKGHRSQLCVAAVALLVLAGTSLLAHFFMAFYGIFALGLWMALCALDAMWPKLRCIVLSAAGIVIAGLLMPQVALRAIWRDYPVLVTLSTLALVMGAWSANRPAPIQVGGDIPIGIHTRQTRAQLYALPALIVALWCSALIPIILLPHFSLPPYLAASLSYEFPLKGVHFWLSSALVVGSAGCIDYLSRLLPQRSIGILPGNNASAALLIGIGLSVLPAGPMLGIKQDEERATAGVVRMMSRHYSLVREGYFKGWPDVRFATSLSARRLFARIQELQRCGVINNQTRIAHVAAHHWPWSAVPFPAFTGVTQDLFVTEPFTPDIHNYQGRIAHLGHEETLEKLMDANWVLLDGGGPPYNSLLEKLTYGGGPVTIAFQEPGLVLLTRQAPDRIRLCNSAPE